MLLHQAACQWFRGWGLAILQYIRMKKLLATVEFHIAVPFFWRWFIDSQKMWDFLSTINMRYPPWIIMFLWQLSQVQVSSTMLLINSNIIPSATQFSHSVMSNSLPPHGLQHTRLPFPSSTLAQTHVHRVGDAIQPSHPLLSPFPPTVNLSQQQGLFQ